MSNDTDKIRVGFYIEKSLLDRCDALLKPADARSRNEFVSAAIRWYIGYLSAKDAVQILPTPITVAVSGAVQSSENRVSRLLFKLAVEIPALQALDGFSHISVIWWFSDFDNKEARNTLDTPQPYKNAPAIMGIFATRSPVRPNPIALTTAQIIQINHEKGIIQIAYIDANDGTPVLDIKPYTPSLDRVETPSVPEWCSHWPMSLERSGSFDWENEFNF